MANVDVAAGDLVFETERGIVNVQAVYISGPMTGYDEYNFPAFREAAETLRAHGLKVFSPHEMDEEEGMVAPEKTKMEYTPRYFKFLARDMELLASGYVDAGVFLPNWQQSRGAKCEYRWLRDLALPTLSYPSLEWLDYRPAGREWL